MDKSKSKQIWQKRNDTAVVVHAFYADLVDELSDNLKNLGTDYDLYITAPENQPQLLSKLSKTFPNAVIIPFINRGRDILPFLEILKKIIPLNYEYLVKVHTKKSVHMAHGNNWRQDLYEKLIGSPDLVKTVKQAFKDNPKLGIIGPEGHVVESRFYMGGNSTILKGLMQRFGYPGEVPERFFFSASTMFWCRPDVFKPFLDVMIEASEFDEEPIPADFTLAHGLERFFGLINSLQGYEIKAVNEDAQVSDPNPYQTIRFIGLPTAFRLKNMGTLVFYRDLNETKASETYRITRPYHLAGVKIIDGVTDGKYSPEQVDSGDALIFQGKFQRGYADYFRLHQASLKYHRPMIYDVDELLFDSSAENKDDKAIIPSISALLDADLLITSTPKLQEVLAPFNPNTTVFPNYLDDQVWELKPVTPKEKDIIRICFIGNENDQADLDSIAPVIKQILTNYSSNLQFEIIGTSTPKCLEGIPGVSWKALPPTEHKDYAEFCQRLNADIFIAPLIDNLYNACKSPLKFFEYSAIGVPGVYGGMDSFKATINHGVDGFLANSHADWFSCLKELILKPELRHNMAMAAQSKVEKQYLLSRNIHSLNDIIGGIVPDQIIDRATKSAQTSYLQKSLVSVLESNDEVNYYKILNELSETKASLKNARTEIEMFKSSTSWKITRPLRRLSELIRKR